eukprot:gnl/TRDRNA2_/TRDRNA2_38092_c0_seq1.p1 gnl/TRDRNA2_/TRDRNA2_38092_c0~~gnl/TRDRNA2_/TRDRNA2_38092_c0_seq1.p1  ORF type:complete len:510 (+),score=71.80 gnl/TRDRNA2_/TRDRNA2_38092_c0_seq1:67-1530(+)
MKGKPAASTAAKRKCAAEEHSSPAKKQRKLVAGCPVVSPQEAGLSEAPLERFRTLVREEVHKFGTLPGVAHAVIVNGQCIFAHADGWSNIESGTKFGLNTLCALHSTTKPLVVAAFLTLVDEGKVALSDAIDKYVPFSEYVFSKVVKTRPTLHHLVTQVAGLRHSDEEAYKQLVSQLARHKITNIAGFCAEMAKIPLQSEPGAMHYYSLSIDILGRICEVVSGKDLETFVSERLCKPLGMADTHFRIPSSKLRRKAVIYDCKRVPLKTRGSNGGKAYRAHQWQGEKMHPGVYSSGGGMLSYADAGMYGTVEDYARFCQMLVNDGRAPDGRQVLRKETVRMLFQDSLAPFAKSDGRVPGWNDFGGPEPKERFYWDRHAWSMLNATLDLEEHPKKSGPPRQGNTLWMYGMGAYWFVDVQRKLVAVSMTQCFSNRRKDRGSDCVPFVKQAIDEGSDTLQSGKLERYYGKEEWKVWLGQSSLTAAEEALKR